MKETVVSKFDSSSFEWAHSGCSWCHPGGGPLEYDREGYRYDGNGGGLGFTGANPTPEQGDYFQVVSGVITSKVANWVSGGVSEADCMMCHYANQYTQVDKNFAAIPTTSGGFFAPKYSATFGLVGALLANGGTRETGLFTPATYASSGVNPTLTGAAGWNTTTIDPSLIVAIPKKENCSVCHFMDRAYTASGPFSAKPLGNTAWQRYIAVGAATDGDVPAQACTAGGTGCNDAIWQVAKGKPEGGKRSETINDPTRNPDAHMDSVLGRGNMTCSDCHYALEGDFDAIISGGNTIVPALTGVTRMDHQFAKGNNLPDSKNMDTLDNTVTCASCHTTREHPYAEELEAPIATHVGLPATHLQKISCRTCHIPVVNGSSDWRVADFSVGTYQTFERNEAWENGTYGISVQPLYLWRDVDPDGGGVMIEPVKTVTVPVWTNNSSLKPTFQRVATTAAQARRTAKGFTGGNADWPLNKPQGGDTFLIVNTKEEIEDMVGRVATASGIAGIQPVLNYYINVFDISHNVAPIARDGSNNPIPGTPYSINAAAINLPGRQYNGTRPRGPLGINGCVECHSKSTGAGANPISIGMFDKTFQLFTNPKEDDTVCNTTEGVVQTTYDFSGTSTKRVALKLTTKNSAGSSFSIDLANVADCAPIGNALNRGEALGYDTAQINALTDFAAMQADTDCSKCHTVDTTVHPTGTNTPTCAQCHAGGADHAANPVTYTVAVANCKTCHMTGGVAAVKSDSSLSAAMAGIHGSAINPGFSTAYGTTDSNPDFMKVNVVGSATCAIAPTYSWNWGDGTANGSGQTATHAYTTGGEKLITLTVHCDGVPAKKARVFTAIAPNASPVPAATVVWDNNTWSVSLSDNSTDAEGISQVVAYWGDGSNTIVQRLDNPATTTVDETIVNVPVTHTYKTKGAAAYTVTLKVTDTNGVSTQTTYTDPVAFGNFSISGKVATTSAGTTGIANATVLLKFAPITTPPTTPKPVAVVYTSSATATKGNFMFNNLKPGRYTMTVTKSPYTFTTDTDLTKTVGPNETGFVIAPNGL